MRAKVCKFDAFVPRSVFAKTSYIYGVRWPKRSSLEGVLGLSEIIPSPEMANNNSPEELHTEELHTYEGSRAEIAGIGRSEFCEAAAHCEIIGWAR